MTTTTMTAVHEDHPRVLTGCVCLDDEFLGGGMHRGSVVGISAQQAEDDFGWALAVQTITQLMGTAEPSGSLPRIHVTTTLAPGTLALALRTRFVQYLHTQEHQGRLLKKGVRETAVGWLGRVVISQVVDLPDLIAALAAQTPQPSGTTSAKEMHSADANASSLDGEHHRPLIHRNEPETRLTAFARWRAESHDRIRSDTLPARHTSPDPLGDEDEHVQQSLPRPQQDTPEETAAPETHSPPLPTKAGAEPPLPADLIVVQNIGALLMNDYNKSRAKDGFHARLRQLNSTLLVLAQPQASTPPLIMLLNGTSAPWHDRRATPSTPAPPPVVPRSWLDRFAMVQPQYAGFLHQLVDVSILAAPMPELLQEGEDGGGQWEGVFGVFMLKDRPMGMSNTSPNCCRELRFTFVSNQEGCLVSPAVG